MHKAEEIFTRIPKTHNCAQSVAAGCDAEERVSELAACGGGRAPEGRCGALHAALLLVPAEKREPLEAEFAARAGAVTCHALKQVVHFPCSACVRLAAELAEKYR